MITSKGQKVETKKVDIKGFDPRYNRAYDVPVIYYDEKDYLIIDKPCVS